MVHKSTMLSHGGGVTTIDGISGDVVLVAGTNITITNNSPIAGDITISASGGKQTYATFSSTASTAGTEQVVECTSGTFTLTLTSPTVGAGQAWVTYFKNSGAGTITLSASIDSFSSWPLSSGSSVVLAFNGTKWLVF